MLGKEGLDTRQFQHSPAGMDAYPRRSRSGRDQTKQAPIIISPEASSTSKAPVKRRRRQTSAAIADDEQATAAEVSPGTKQFVYHYVKEQGSTDVVAIVCETVPAT